MDNNANDIENRQERTPCEDEELTHCGEIKLYMDCWKEKTNRGEKYTVPKGKVISIRFKEEDVGSVVLVYVRRKSINKAIL